MMKEKFLSFVRKHDNVVSVTIALFMFIAIVITVTIAFIFFINNKYVSSSVSEVASVLNNDNDKNMFVYISDIPEGWTKTNDSFAYYYHIDTNVVYIASYRFNSDHSLIVKLESEDYSTYIYDKDTNSFIGVR